MIELFLTFTAKFFVCVVSNSIEFFGVLKRFVCGVTDTWTEIPFPPRLKISLLKLEIRHPNDICVLGVSLSTLLKPMLRNDKSYIRTGFLHYRCEGVDNGLGYGTTPIFAFNDVSNFVDTPNVYREDIHIHRATRRLQINLDISTQTNVTEDTLNTCLKILPVLW